MKLVYSKPCYSQTPESYKYFCSNAPSGIYAHPVWRNRTILEIESVHIDRAVAITFDLHETLHEWKMRMSKDTGCIGDRSYDMAGDLCHTVGNILASASRRANGFEVSRNLLKEPVNSARGGYQMYSLKGDEWKQYRDHLEKAEQYVRTYLNRFGEITYGENFYFPVNPECHWNIHDPSTWLYPPCKK